MLARVLVLTGITAAASKCTTTPYCKDHDYGGVCDSDGYCETFADGVGKCASSCNGLLNWTSAFGYLYGISSLNDAPCYDENYEKLEGPSDADCDSLTLCPGDYFMYYGAAYGLPPSKITGYFVASMQNADSSFLNESCVNDTVCPVLLAEFNTLENSTFPAPRNASYPITECECQNATVSSRSGDQNISQTWILKMTPYWSKWAEYEVLPDTMNQLTNFMIEVVNNSNVTVQGFGNDANGQFITGTYPWPRADKKKKDDKRNWLIRLFIILKWLQSMFFWW